MRKLLGKTLTLGILIMCCHSDLVGQNIKITDTLKVNPNISGIKNDSSFIVEGKVVGLDSGSIKIFLPGSDLVKYIPIRQGQFFFSGIIKSLKLIHFLIKGDYNDNIFYLEPGEIKIKYLYQHKFTASGTKENDLSNYFMDTLNKKNSERFWELSNKVKAALKEENLSLYLKLIDSFTIVEKNFLKTVNEAVSQKKYGFYLLGCVNYHYINYGYFSERKAIFDELPEAIKNSEQGKQALDFLHYTKTKNSVGINKNAYMFNLISINNKRLDLNKFKGNTIVLDFWASWCIPCIKSLPLLRKIQANKVSKNVVYISVSIDKKEKEWRDKEKNIDIPWLSLLADEATIKNYGITAIPNYIVINKEGKIVSRSTSLDMLYTTLIGLEN